MPGHWRSYTEAERASAVGRAMTIGTKRASAELGIPRRTLSSWLQRPTPEVQVAIVRTREDVASRLWEAVTAGTDAVLAGLRDPKARLGDKAQALRIVVEAHALISGEATSRTETTVRQEQLDEERQAGEWRNAIEMSTPEELAEWLAEAGFAQLKTALEEARTERLAEAHRRSAANEPPDA